MEKSENKSDISLKVAFFSSSESEIKVHNTKGKIGKMCLFYYIVVSLALKNNYTSLFFKTFFPLNQLFWE